MPDRSVSTPIPDELKRQVEDDTTLGSCDWGHCHRDQAGWAKSVRDEYDEWLPICGPCSLGEFAEGNVDPFPVTQFVRLADVEAALGLDGKDGQR